jgi:hypothetical protein
LKNFIALISVELKHTLSVEVNVLNDGLFIPSMPLSEIVNIIENSQGSYDRYYLLGEIDEDTQEFTEVLEVKCSNCKASDSSFEIGCFRKITKSMESSEYASEVLGYLSRGNSYVQLGAAYVNLYPSTGVYTKVEDRPSVAICTPCYLRTDLLKIYCDYMVKYVIPHLVWSGIEACLILCGGEEEKKSIRHLLDVPNVLFFTHRNNLGEKKNLMFDYVRELGFDYATTIDSDDFVHPNTIVDLLDVASQNGMWSAIEPFYFQDIATGQSGVFEGYPGGHLLHKWGMGSARVFTRAGLGALGSSPFSSGNRCMDDSIKSRLAKMDLAVEDRLLSSEDCSSRRVHIPIGIKSATNIWKMKDYKVRAVNPSNPSINWLPPEIRLRIEGLRQPKV